MAARHIIFVPGKNPKPEAAAHRALVWRALVEGVRRADGTVADQLLAHAPQFHLVSWNFLYYREYKDISLDVPWVDAVINRHGPSGQDIRDTHSWFTGLSRLLLTLADHVPPLIRFLPKEVRSTANDIGRYFNNSGNVAIEIRAMLKQQLRPLLEKQAPILLIGHSLGSVIAYDTLWELSRKDALPGKVDLLTLGSPLGMHYIQRRLLGWDRPAKSRYPGTIRRWINVAAEGDVTALDRDFRRSFAPMLELGLVDSIEDHCHGIYNFFRSEEGLNSHRSYGYLVNPAVGHIIAEWWKGR